MNQIGKQLFVFRFLIGKFTQAAHSNTTELLSQLRFGC